MTGLKGERGIVAFMADELIYIKDNNRSNTPFGLGKMEVAFNTISAFLGVQDMSSKAGSDQVHKTWLWWKTPIPPAHVQTVRRHIQNELEGQQKLSLIAGIAKPDIVQVQPVTPQDLLMEWQQFLVKVIANSFDLSPQAFGMEQRAMARNTGEIMALADFRQAVVPMAVRIQEALTRNLFHGMMGWRDLQFEFNGLDDPDTQTKVMIQQRLYAMNAITPDEIRDDRGDAALPGGWGKLTMTQSQILMAEAAARLGQKAPGMGGGGAAGMMPASMPGGGMGDRGDRGGAPVGQVFSADDITRMTPEDVMRNQELGFLPGSYQDMGQQMEEQSPGILRELSDELREFLEYQMKQEAKDTTEAQPVTRADEKGQIRRFQQGERSLTVAEQALMDRGAWRVPGTGMQPSVRGRYPRNETGR